MTGLPRWLSAADLGATGRSLLGVLAAAAAGLHWGPPGAATAAAGAAAIAGATALQDSPRGRLPLVTVISLQMGAAVLLGAATSSYGVLFVMVVTGWCFLAGLQWAVSSNAGLIAAASGVLLVASPPVAPSISGLVTATLLAIGGGLVQAVLIAIWPRRRWRTQRDALTRAYRSLGVDAQKLAADPDASVDPGPLIQLRNSFTLTDRQARRRPLAYRTWYGLPERISVTLTAFAGKFAGDDHMAELLGAAAQVLDVVAERNRSAESDVVDAMRRFDTAVDAVAPPNMALARRLSTQLREAVALRFGELAPDPNHVTRLGRQGLGGLAVVTVAAVRVHARWGSPVLRHAIRLAAAAGAGVAIERFADVPFGYWIPLTVLLVLRPETAHTYTRCIGRVGGSAAGIAVASVVIVIWHPTGMAAAVLAALTIAVAYVISRFGYLPLSAALAAAIVFLIEITGVVGGGALIDRLIATLIGGALAILAHVALPDHSLIRLRQRAGELMKTEIDYAATVIKAFVHDLDRPGEALAAAWERAFRARAAFEAAAGAATSDSRDLRRWLKSYRAALNAVTTSCAALEGSLPAQPSPTLSGDFVVAVDEYAEALCGAPATPGAPWRIDGDRIAGADLRIRDAATHLGPEDMASRVLVAELATITSSLVGIADL